MIDLMEVAGSGIVTGANIASIYADNHVKMFIGAKPFRRLKDWTAAGTTGVGLAIDLLERRPGSAVGKLGNGMFLGGLPVLGESLFHLAQQSATEAFPNNSAANNARRAFELRQRQAQEAAAQRNRNTNFSRPGSIADVAVVTG